MMNIKNDIDEIQSLFKKYQIEGFINIWFSENKSLEYAPLYDELSFDKNQSISTSITIYKDHKKANFSIDGYSIEKIEWAIQEMLKLIDFWEYDTDILLPNITDTQEKDFSSREVDKMDFDFMRAQYKTLKDFSFAPWISIEWFAIGMTVQNHYYLNSLWSLKHQNDNHTFYYIDLFWENNEKRDTHSKHISNKNLPILTSEIIHELQQELLNKISDSKTMLSPWIYDIVLEREVVIDFLHIILSNLSAESIREWMSMFSKNKLWEKIFSDHLTLVNNPFLEGYTGNMLFDKEWVTLKTTPLIEKWVLKSKFCDYKNVLKEGKDFLGNSTLTNIELIAKPNPDYLFWNTFLFTNLMAFHTVDTSSGKFSLSGEWYLLENGKKKEYIKNISLSWDIIHLFSHIKDFWNDFKTDGNFKVPSMSFSSQKLV